MNELTLEFLSYLKEHGRSERTRQAYAADLERYISWCEAGYGLAFNVSMVNRSDLADYQHHCRKLERVKAATWNRYLASLTLFAAWLGVDISAAMTRAGTDELAPHSLNEHQYKRMRNAVNEAVRTAKSEAAERQALRNAAIFTLLADAGLREGEVVHLRVSDVLLGERKGRVILYDAKGNKDRTIPLDWDSTRALRSWLAVRPANGCDALLVGKFGDRLQERGIQKLVAGIALDARIEHVTPHQLRHTFGYRLYKRGIALHVIAKLMGHSSIQTTRRYTLPHWEDLESAVGIEAA